MKWASRNRVAIGFGVTLAIVVVNAIVTYRNITKVITSNAWVTHTNQVLAALEATLSTLKDAETGQRGYIITGQERFLAPYHAASASISNYVQQVKQLTADNPNQQQRIALLEQKIASKFAYYHQVIALRQQKGFAAAQQLVLSGRGKQEMDQSRGLIAQMKQEELLLLQRRVKDATQSAQETIVTFSIASGVSLVLLGLVSYLVKQHTQERDRAEKTLRVSEARFRRLAESNIIGVIFADFHGKIWQANEAFVQMLGYTHEDLRWGKVRWDTITPPEFRDIDEAAIAQIKQFGVASTFEKEYIRRDGSRVPVLIGAAQLEAGQDHCICFVLDLSKRKQAETALNLSTRRLKALHEIDRAILAAQSMTELAQAALAHLSELVPYQQAYLVLFDFEQSEAQLIAVTKNKDLEPTEGTVIPIVDWLPDQVWMQQQSIRHVEDMTALETRPTILERRLAEGMHSFLAVSLIAEQELIGELQLFATQPAAFNLEYQEIAQEVAAQLAIAIQQARLREQLINYTAQLEQRVAERTAELQAANTELEAFAYSVSHDLRAPLRAMQGFAQALLEDYSHQFDSLGQDYTRRIVLATSRMDTLINDLLTYSRLSRAEIRLQPLSLTVMVEEALAQIEAEIQEQQAQITVEPQLPVVLGHRTTLIQVLINLLSNAIKFVPAARQPQINVWAEELSKAEAESSHSRSKWIRLWVQDNGIGIASEHQQRIFRVFERLHGMDTYPGTGIGLAIARKGIERMGGQIGVKSQVGQGSRFWLQLPKVVRDEA